MASSSSFLPDIWQWITSLPDQQWRGEPYSLQICSSPSTNQSLNLVVSRHSETQILILSLSVCAAHLHDPITLWSSSSSKLKSAANYRPADAASQFILDVICGVLNYGPYSSCNKVQLRQLQVCQDSGEVLNLAVLTLALMVCIYEAPASLRREFIDAIGAKLSRDEMRRRASRKLMLSLGSSLEEQWMRSLNLGVTNWIMETDLLRSVDRPAVFSYAVSASRLWKVQVYCPVVAMAMEHSSSPHHYQVKDEKLLFSLNYQQLESVIQFVYRVSLSDYPNWIDITVNVDNIRCDVIQLVSETLMAKRGYGSDEKHFPSRVSLQLTPLAQTDILSLSVGRSSENPVQEVGTEKGVDASLAAAPVSMGIAVSAHETVTRSMKPWKFEQAVHGNTATLSWFLHGGGAAGREVFSSEPGKMELLFFQQPRSWFRNRYSSASRLFTRGGGVIFAGDEYGEGVCWRMRAGVAGKTMEWELKGSVWVTYWPNKKRSTLHTETRRIDFTELLHLKIQE